jgi:hypothetical protein
MGAIAAGLLVLLFPEALHDPRVAQVVQPHVLAGAKELAQAIFGRLNVILVIYDEPVFQVARFFYRGVFLIACVAIGYSRIDTRRPTIIFGVAIGITLLLAFGLVPAGVTADFARWYLFALQAALILTAGHALVLWARERTTIAAHGAGAALLVAVTIGTGLSLSDFYHMSQFVRSRALSGGDLAAITDLVRKAKGDARSCAMIAPNNVLVEGLAYQQRRRELDYLEATTPCRFANGSFVQKGIVEGRALQQFPSRAAIDTAAASMPVIFIGEPAIFSTYQAALAKNWQAVGSWEGLGVWRLLKNAD